ncbi:MAG: thioesterase family protein [Chitinophagaceae bacterium]
MSRIKIDLPEKFSFTTQIAVRITDLNYGGHVGNDAILSIIHEARMRFLSSLGYTELKFAGVSLIMADVGIEFKNELFYGDTVIAFVTIGDISKASFDVYYKLEKESGDKKILIAIAKTGMVCYDYENRKIVLIPGEVKERLAISN